MAAPPPGKAAVYLFRPYNFVGSAATIEIGIDGKVQGVLGLRTFLCAFVEPGTHEIQLTAIAGLGGRQPVGRQSFQVDVGKVIYMEGGPGWNSWRFRPIPEERGLKLVKSYQLTGTEGIGKP